jgi:putative transposase
MQNERFENNEKYLSGYSMSNLIPSLKKEFEFLNNADSIALQNTTSDLAESFENFFKSISGKRKGPKVNIPKHKKKHGRQSYRTRNVKVLDDSTLFIPKLKEVEAVIHRPIPDDAVIVSTTISKNSDGRYYASIITEHEKSLHRVKNKEVGCDLGIKYILITSDGIKFKNPNELEHIARTKRLLKLKQKQFSRTAPNSNNREKHRVQLARLYSKLTRQRNEYYHIISKYLVDNYDTIHLEDLVVCNMLKNRKLSRVIREAAWTTLTDMIDYKAKWAGVTYNYIDKYFPSSKTCSGCGYKLESLVLEMREWICPSCSSIHDRDLNAAINILHEGQRQCYGVKLSSPTTGDVGFLPVALQKMTDKIERSANISQLVMGVSK